jgi:hypothetical protein
MKTIIDRIKDIEIDERNTHSNIIVFGVEVI